MTGILTGALLLAGYLILTLPSGSGASLMSMPTSRITGWRRPARSAALDPAELPLFVHQLTALLQGGRSPHQLWQDVALLYAAADDGSGRQDPTGFAQLAAPVLRAAQQAAAIGAGVPEVLRAAATEPPGPRGWRPGRPRTPPSVCAGLWRDLAVCLEISERSGAPLTEVLGRYAAQLDLALDSASARATALAGPKATARLLGWLPVFGLGLGYLTGLQPLAVLLGSAAGITLLCTGGALMLLGRFWSGRLVATAGKEPG
ncbi:MULTISPECIES: type II secretion system F family protein [unclassified Arthrobacter]|uniref:type II secretion system F family protein n=1 Tax=unclassified Arthrobacter TaxID=235627 RepID=UPI0014922A78|nr:MULTISPECIES: hypothetical protein [unclassified Arthrobacter]NOJ63413.1 hypothetical protein [Arthrobacter sp. 147(2020)]